MQTLIEKARFVVLMWTLFVFPMVAHAGTLHVNCDSKKGLTRIQRAIDILQQGGSEGTNTILVSGSCQENITIQSMDNLTLTTQNGASITDPSNGNLDVIDIVDSRRVSINGFTINGGAVGILCGSYSLCRFRSNTIQNAGTGVFLNSSQASFAGDTLQNNASRGLGVANGGQVSGDSLTVQGNGAGVSLLARGTLILTNSMVQGNQNFGIRAVAGSTIRIIASTLTANHGNGVELDQSAQARFESFTGSNGITNNSGVGVFVADLSWAGFDVNSNVTGNAAGHRCLLQSTVQCHPRRVNQPLGWNYELCREVAGLA
jgi:hypothetical protein